jgi:Rod binding domain-containing protein
MEQSTVAQARRCFTSMMDEKLADELPGQWHHGIGEGLIRQLRNALSQSHPTAATEKK